MKQAKKTPVDIYQQRAKQPDFRRLGDIASSFVLFVILLEDGGFFGHKRGYDSRLLWSAFTDAVRGKDLRGYSTITQQLAKNLYFTFERRLKRKFLELIYAADFEKHLAKKHILELYINTIYYDNGQYGICNASRFYFHCEPADLTVNQAFFLASLLPVVGICNPLYHPEEYVKHRNRKLNSIRNIISEETAEEILRHGPDCLDEALCKASPETDTYNAPGPMVNERFGPGGWEALTDTTAYETRDYDRRNSPLVEYMNLSPNHSGLRTHCIDRITPHCTDGQVAVDGLGSFFSRESKETSSNYGIDRHGRVGVYVTENNCSWCSSNPGNDQRAVTIECSSDKSDPCKMNDAVYRTLIRLCTDICRRNGKKKLLWLEDKEKTLNYAPAPDEMVITVHRWFSDKTCPGDWLYSRLGDLAEKVTASLSRDQQEHSFLTPERRAKELLSHMSIEEKIGQIVLIDFRRWLTAEEAKKGEKNPKPLTVLNDEIRNIIQKYHCGNIILFEENCADTKSLCKLTYDLQQTALEGGNLPLLIGVDQEGGDITKLGRGTGFSGNMALGLSGDPANAYLSGQVIGSELKAVGINCNFSPVADVISNPDNSVLGTRSFSNDADLTAEMAVAMSEGIMSRGVISCAKHFPGHGATGDDSHNSLPLISSTKREWSRRDALPFRNLIRSSIPMIMTGHLRFPAMDRTKYRFSSKSDPIYLPATLSRRITTGILKRRMGYRGVVVTDSLKMEAISEYFPPPVAAVRALCAGADMLCMPAKLRSPCDEKLLEAIYAAIKSATKHGFISHKRLDDAVTRILVMKIRAGILDADYNYDVRTAAEAAEAFVGGYENREIERRIADACIKLVYNGEFETFKTNDEKRTVFFMPYKDSSYSVLHAINCMEKSGKKLNTRVFCYQGLDELTPEMIVSIKETDNLVVGSAGLPGKSVEETAQMIAIPQKILSQTSAKHVAIICIGASDQTQSFDDRYPQFLLGSCGGMNLEDVGSEKYGHRYNPAIPAAVYRIFGV